MSLDVFLLETRRVSVFDANVTHDLTRMAGAAGFYEILWRPYETGIREAEQLIEPLTQGLARLKSDPARYEQLNALNDREMYKPFVSFVERYLAACIKHPGADVSVSR